MTSEPFTLEQRVDATLRTMKSARSKDVRMNIWESDVLAIEDALAAIRLAAQADAPAIQPQRTREAALEAAALDFVAKVERGEARSERSYQAFKRALSITRPDDPPQCAPDREALVRAIQLSYARKDLEPTSATTLALYREDAENAADAVLALTRPDGNTP